MALVALDSNVVDLVAEAVATPELCDAMEATEPPPSLDHVEPHLVAEVYACFWLIALARYWRSIVYTFSDRLYEEIARASERQALLTVAFDVLVREEQEPEYRNPDRARRPNLTELTDLGIRGVDGEHVADAIALRCDFFLTNDRRLRNRSKAVEKRWGLRLRRPSEFLVEAVKAGAPWTTWAPWPWETISQLYPASR